MRSSLMWGPPFPWIVRKLGVGNHDKKPRSMKSWIAGGKKLRDHLQQFFYFTVEDAAPFDQSWLFVYGLLIIKLK